jgi:DNA polymerase III subunit gamma/tau
MEVVMSYYQRYRPQNFSDLLGQNVTVDTILAQLKSGKTAQAYLFIGHKGTGKTTTARLLAKSLNCEHPKNGEPCGKCVSCEAVINGAHLDVIEIDAASNRGIEEIRDLREKVKLSPTQGRMKVYIIDEVHMLTMEAFNALLKTLEEPPASVVFILCTTDSHKVPLTVLSRCQRFEFNRAREEALTHLLKEVSSKEGVSLGEDDLANIIQASDGSYRDALTILEQASFGGTSSVSFLADLTFGKDKELFELIESSNVSGALNLINNLYDKGCAMAVLNERLIRRMREKLLIAVDEKDLNRQRELAALLRIFSDAQAQLRVAVLPTLPLELALVESAMVGEFAVTGGVAVPASEKVPESIRKEEVKEEVVKWKQADVSVKVDPEGSPEDLQSLKDQWNILLRSVKPLNHSLEAFLRGCEASDVSGKSVTLKFFYKFHKDMIDQAKNRKLVEEELAKLLGRDVRLKTVLGDRPLSRRVKFEDVQNVEEVASEDLAQKAVDIFNSGIS